MRGEWQGEGKQRAACREDSIAREVKVEKGETRQGRECIYIGRRKRTRQWKRRKKRTWLM